MNKELELIEIESICPICSKGITELWVARLDTVIGIRYAYICCECKKLLKLSNKRYDDISDINQSIFSQTVADE